PRLDRDLPGERERPPQPRLRAREPGKERRGDRTAPRVDPPRADAAAPAPVSRRRAPRGGASRGSEGRARGSVATRPLRRRGRRAPRPSVPLASERNLLPQHVEEARLGLVAEALRDPYLTARARIVAGQVQRQREVVVRLREAGSDPDRRLEVLRR